MAIPVSALIDPSVRRFVEAVNAGDRAAFEAALAPHATMSDDGTDRDLSVWADEQIFLSHGRMEPVEQSQDGRQLVVAYTNDTYGTMRTRWFFSVAADGRVDRFDTGQATG
ncbi:hypothetical protein BIV57_03190 [Mangrovactinospora gilvigrisea]|uniref:SnoaL-like domain-containing protein n=1 Tax=Mangrovactinospora gilvigrisea TaxID=1428644 RepID=A0A1J7CBT3_9ACTN|nr:nuclear transport factor 2 family protein [Mangrovactinospora gilvigrisea]OIV38972.1 hypothetical protein BIV57_03190 [Mangrovactinospora gilvigrisea]